MQTHVVATHCCTAARYKMDLISALDPCHLGKVSESYCYTNAPPGRLLDHKAKHKALELFAEIGFCLGRFQPDFQTQ